MTTFVPLLLLALLVWFWLDSARAREIATGICQTACEQRNLQFLDQTVALRRLGLRWTRQGIRIRRLFQFDYSEEGVGRHDGHVIMVGVQLEEFSLGLPSLSDKVVPLRPKPPEQ
ncbi:DUF3301 domain-containing protein [Sedimenticola thiotaurini]|uniref:DUF3301 domain-containing protein n=1 Tax=Sedimenticola thiotaurini TaxID=1543721 RepID=A0A0F7JYZ5_9GAMM|nr:DUF3301 domain-containing protein [Sedimenticola thiotaurini]AKH20897.1 hypothetical protein AAY24_11675 [Sedimenticola thiotaurini]